MADPLPAFARALGLSLVAGLAACATPHEPPPSPPGGGPSAQLATRSPSFALAAVTPPRPPVLGHRLEPSDEPGRFRLVDVEAGVTVGEGDLDHCERLLAQRLQERYGRGKPNLPFPTLGGRQFWGDLFWYADWRIQENVLSGHCRLLDPDDVRRAWGTYAECRAAFEQERVERNLSLPSTHVVVLLHGLARSTAYFDDLAEALREAGFAPARFEYPSTRASIDAHASQLVSWLDRLEDAERVSFVTHSLGGLVVRAALAKPGAWRERIEPHRLVMLGPPNRGSSLAAALREFLPYRWLAGPAGQDLALREALAVPPPPIPFAIIAGARGDGEGWNPLVPGDDDGVVALDEALLEGADEVLVLRTWHARLPSNHRAIEATVRFLHTSDP